MGKPWKHIIPFRSFVESEKHWMEIYNNIRSGKEKLVSSKVVDAETIEIITEETN